MPIKGMSVIVLVVTLAAQVAAAAGPEPNRPRVCTEQYVPVCGEKDGARKTYSNACFAAADGAAVVTDGQCPPIAGPGPKTR